MMGVCKPKNLGGLGFLAFSWWTWPFWVSGDGACFQGASSIWRDILTARYRVASIISCMGGRVEFLRPVSPCWRGVSLLGAKVGDTFDWFKDGFPWMLILVSLPPPRRILVLRILSFVLDSLDFLRFPIKLISLYGRGRGGNGTSSGWGIFFLIISWFFLVTSNLWLEVLPLLWRVVCGGGTSQVTMLITCLLPTPIFCRESSLWS